MRLSPSVLAVIPALLALPAHAQGAASTYSRHDYQRCPKLAAEEADGVSVRRCRGPGGIAVTWRAGDDASFVSFGPRETGATAALGSFFEAGPTIEWRGPAGRAPVAAILRYRVGRSVGRLDRTRLVVHRLGPGESCVVGVVDGARPAANEAARDIADNRAAGFACAKDRPIEFGARP